MSLAWIQGRVILALPDLLSTWLSARWQTNHVVARNSNDSICSAYRWFAHHSYSIQSYSRRRHVRQQTEPKITMSPSGDDPTFSQLQLKVRNLCRVQRIPKLVDRHGIRF